MKNHYTTFDSAPRCRAWILAYVCVLHYVLLYLLSRDEGSSAGGGKQSPSKRQLKMVEYLAVCLVDSMQRSPCPQLRLAYSEIPYENTTSNPRQRHTAQRWRGPMVNSATVVAAINNEFSCCCPMVFQLFSLLASYQQKTNCHIF